MPIAGFFDMLLATVLTFLAWRLLAHPDLFKAVVLFIVFGLFLSLVWVRLQAPDVALAEAAIGAGLTGALFLTALGRMRTSHPPTSSRNHEDHGGTNDPPLP